MPYYKQTRDNYCGPACLQMVFAFYGLTISQDELAKQLKVSEETGADNRELVRVIEEAGFSADMKTGATWEDIERPVKKGVPVIVNFIEPSENGGHFAVVTNVEGDALVLNDPWNGQNFRIGKDDFLSRWRSGFEEYQRWLLVVYPANTNPDPSADVRMTYR